MHSKQSIVQQLLHKKTTGSPKNKGEAFAPTNIALCKYWGKRNLVLNLPITDSLSIGLADKGATATLTPTDDHAHTFIVNHEKLVNDSPHYQKLAAFINLFNCEQPIFYQMTLQVNVPLAAGLASSACIFASIVKALNDLYQWQLDDRTLSILARLGSGSACRSIYPGFVEWQRGQQLDGLDSFGIPLTSTWPGLCIGLYLINQQPKSLSSRDGMQRTVKTSALYTAWPEKCERDLAQLKKAIAAENFSLLGKTAESNALAMHATMLAAWPPILYSQPETITLMTQIWSYRDQGLDLYFTQDAGPNLKLLFLEKDKNAILAAFPGVEIIQPFKGKLS